MATCQTNNNQTQLTNEDYLKYMAQVEDQIDYQFIQRIIQDLTQSCALPLPIPAASIPPLIIQAAQYFWENYDFAVEERLFCIKNADFCKYCGNKIMTLPQQIISVFGVYKTTDIYNYGVLGDFSLERIVMNNSLMAGGAGGQFTDVFGQGIGYNMVDVMGALYEVQTYKALFQSPLTYNYNPYSNKLVILGDLGYADLILQCYTRCKIQDLYKLYYFFRYCVCLGKKSMATILGTFEYKLPGGIVINYARFEDSADQEMEKIDEWLRSQHSADYFFTSNSI